MSNFEYIILNNGSVDGTAGILARYEDPRIRVVQQENLGISRCFEQGNSNGKSDLIIRLDADDVSDPNRLEKQINFMNQHPEIVLCGSPL